MFCQTRNWQNDLVILPVLKTLNHFLKYDKLDPDAYLLCCLTRNRDGLWHNSWSKGKHPIFKLPRDIVSPMILPWDFITTPMGENP